MDPLAIPHKGTPAERLDGWKEIASHLGRGVRTAQRWESLLGLPVRRIDVGGAEAVHALKSEIDTWLARKSRNGLARQASDAVTADGNGDSESSAPPATLPPSPTLLPVPTPQDPEPAETAGPPRRRWIAVTLAVLAMVVSVAAWRSFEPSPADATAGRAPLGSRRAEPATVTSSGHTLSAFGSQKELLWQHAFEVPLLKIDDARSFNRATAVRDIDNDGHEEVLFATTRLEDRRVYGFNHDGTVRFVHTVTRPVSFGQHSSRPILFTNVLVEDRPRFPYTFWVWGQHAMFFPSVLQRLDAKGAVQTEYWSNGFIVTVASVELGGRWATLVGATNNENNGASLAAFFGDVNGSAPAADKNYRCTGCPAGKPDIFLVFPRSRLSAEQSWGAHVSEIARLGDNRVLVSVLASGPAAEGGGIAYYILNEDLRIIGTDRSDAFETLQKRLEAENKVSPATRFRGEQDFYPVKRWNGTGYDLITGPEAR